MAAINHNSGINYTLYYGVLDYFKTIMDNHPSIALVTQGNIVDFDTREFPQYPVGNVSILRADFGQTTTDYEIQLIIADKIKNKNDESEPTTNEQEIAFYGVDDVVDIHANTLAILNDLTAYTQKSVDGFEINGTITNEPFEERFNNGLAGFVSTFTLTVHNDRNRCLFELLPQPTTTAAPTPTTTTTIAPTTTTTTIAPTTTLSPTTTTLSPTTTVSPTTTLAKPIWRIEFGGFPNSTQVQAAGNNPNGWYLGWLNHRIYSESGCTSYVGDRGFSSGSLTQLFPGANNYNENYNTAGYNTSQYYTFGSASLADGNGGAGANPQYIISGSGLYDFGTIIADVTIANCLSVTQEP